MTSVVSDLVFDVGFHLGEDTALYLAKGYRVVAFEAHPEHALRGRIRFAREIADGRLVLLEGAISASEASTVTFYVNDANSEWGTTDFSWASRNSMLGTQNRPIDVTVVDFAAALRERGTPYYMKVDIEGADDVCFEALSTTGRRPAYVSREATKTAFHVLRNEVAVLEALGYDSYCVRQQARRPGRLMVTEAFDGQRFLYRAERTASGDFGPALKPWVSRRVALARFRAIYTAYRLVGDTGLLRRTRVGHRLLSRAAGSMPFPLPGWHDIHGRHRDWHD